LTNTNVLMCFPKKALVAEIFEKCHIWTSYTNTI